MHSKPRDGHVRSASFFFFFFFFFFGIFFFVFVESNWICPNRSRRERGKRDNETNDGEDEKGRGVSRGRGHRKRERNGLFSPSRESKCADDEAREQRAKGEDTDAVRRRRGAACHREQQ